MAAELLRHEPAALAAGEKELASEIGLHEFGQFLFDRQWLALKKFANERGVKIHRRCADLRRARFRRTCGPTRTSSCSTPTESPTVVAGVPPDYFSADGQHWGNPIYDWARMKETGFAWWVARMRRQLEPGRS